MNTKLKNYALNRFFKIAKDLVENPTALKFKLKSILEKLNKKGIAEALGSRFKDIKTLLRLIQAWLSRSYTDVSKQSIIYSVMAVVYFFTPTDFVPDFLLGLGFIDDIAVINWVITKIKIDLDKFKLWESENAQ